METFVNVIYASEAHYFAPDSKNCGNFLKLKGELDLVRQFRSGYMPRRRIILRLRGIE